MLTAWIFGSWAACPLGTKLYSDQHDGDQKAVQVLAGGKLTIKPHANTQKWVVTSMLDALVRVPHSPNSGQLLMNWLQCGLPPALSTAAMYQSCTASIDFNVAGKPNPPPVNLTLSFWELERPSTNKQALIFTDESAPAPGPCDYC